MDGFRFEQAVDGLGQSAVMTIPETAPPEVAILASANRFPVTCADETFIGKNWPHFYCGRGTIVIAVFLACQRFCFREQSENQAEAFKF